MGMGEVIVYAVHRPHGRLPPHHGTIQLRLYWGPSWRRLGVRNLLALLVLLEGFLLGLASAVVGTIIGTGLTYPLATTGLDFSEAMGETMMVEGVAMDAVMVAQYAPDRMLLYAVVAILMTMLASAWPAIRVSRMRPIQAIQHQ